MAKFAEYAPERSRSPRLGPEDGLVVRPAVEADLRPIARIVAEREGDDFDVRFDRLQQEFEAMRNGGERALWTAALGADVIGFGRVTRFTPPPDAPADAAPAGWYLMGVIVAPAHRGRGVGEALTRTRLAWIAEREREAWYFANARNRVSIELHRKFGFVEVTRNFWFPGVSFEGGVGVLFRRDLHASAPS